MIGHGGTTFALVEAGTTPVAMTYNLETVGYDNFDGTLPGAFSAHTKLDAIKNELHAVCYAYPNILEVNCTRPDPSQGQQSQNGMSYRN